MHQERATSLEKELHASQKERERLQQLIEQLKAQLQDQRQAESSSLPRSHKLGGSSGGNRVSGPSGGIRYSWQVTDIDDAIAQHRQRNGKKQEINSVGASHDDIKVGDDDATPTATPIPLPGSSDGIMGWGGDEPEAMTSHLMLMLESQVSKLDKKLA